MRASAARTQAILGRFPRHLEADRPGKLFELVVGAGAAGLDVETAQIGRVRRAHRLAHADEHVDLLMMAALHRVREEDVSVLALRLAAVRALGLTLADESAASAEVTAAFEGLMTHLGLPPDVFPAWPADATDPPLSDAARLAAARARLADALAALGAYRSELDLLRARLRAIIALHREGNGTVRALLGGAAANLDLDVESIHHLDGGFTHVARCRDRLRLLRPEPPGTLPVVARPLPAVDLVALEENPFVDRNTDPVDRLHADLFRVLRPGFDPVFATVKVVGVGDRTVRPLVVNRDQGLGLGYHGAVADGQELRFETDGAVLLDGADAATLAWSFRGAVFSSAATPAQAHPLDFVFTDEGAPDADRVAHFAVTGPAGDAFDPTFVWPHPAGALEPAQLAVGETRFAFFIQQASYGSAADGADVPALPVPLAGELDGSVYAPPPPVTAPAAQGKVGFDWREREPFAVRVWLPQRLAALDVEGQMTVRERVRIGLERHRPAGVHVYVDYATDLWSLGDGVLGDLAADASGEGLIVNGTRLWADGTAQPA